MSVERRFKDDIYERIARIGKAVSSPKRLELLDLLGQGPRTVEMLAGESNLGIANTSRHLQVLRGAGLVESRKQGLFVTYGIAAPEVSDFYRGMRTFAETRIPDIERILRQFLQGREGLEPVNREELVERVRRSTVTVLDMRPVEEFDAGHIPGAISVPLRELERRLDGLPKDREFVAYCRGPYCVMAVKAVEFLQGRGFKAARLEDGIHDWQARGLEIATGKEG